MSKKLFLIDGTALIYRAFFAFIRNPLYNSKGENTSAIFGTINSFLKLLERYSPEHIAISFDRKEKTFRHEITETYKAHRPPTPDELIAQVEPIKKFFELIHIPEISCAGYEADDVLATIAERYKDEYEVIIVTGDKDFAQLVDERVMLYDPFKEAVTKPEDVVEKYGLKPEQFIDYLAICGDAADNIPGVKGIGPKGAAKLLNQYGTLEGIYDNLENISAKGTRTKLETSREEAFLSQKLAVIVRDVPLDIKEDRDFYFSRENLKNSIELLEEYDLGSVVKKIMQFCTPKEAAFETEFDFGLTEEEKVKFDSILVDDEDKFSAMLADLEDKPVVAIDTETTSTDPLLADLVGVSLCAEKEKAYYISIEHQMEKNLPLDLLLKQLPQTLKGKKLIAHNIKYDYQVLQNAGWEIENEVFDTMIADYLLNPTLRHSLEACSERELSHKMIPITDLIGKGKKQITFNLVSSAAAAQYSGEDANVTFRLYEIYEYKLIKSDLYPLFKEIEMPLFKALAQMEKNGVYIDTALLKQLSKQNQKQIGELSQEIYKIAGSVFNLNSTQQLAKVLFEDMGIPPVKKIKTGYSTDASVLEELAIQHKIARLLIEYRQLTKLESTYITALPQLINPRTGRVHSSFNQTVTITGRLSSTNPNMQNIPVRSEMGKEIRKAFRGQDAEHVIMAADYSQIELRLLAIFSQDEKMVEAFRAGHDIHSETASIIFDIPKEDVTSDQRRYAKVINFGLMYGMGSFRISQELEISRKEAKEFVENYFAKFPTIRAYLDKGIEKAKKNGYAETIYGRKLYLPDLNSRNKMKVKEAERVATNMPIQGSAADIIKIAMINLSEKIKNDPDIRMIIQVHDELVFEVKKGKEDYTRELIRNEMENALPTQYAGIVSLLVEIGVGENWNEAH